MQEYGKSSFLRPQFPVINFCTDISTGAPYNIPTQFGYYAPPAHTRQPATSSILPPHHPDHPDMPPNSARPPNTNEEQSETSEFGGLVSYFSSQQELD